MKKAITAIRSFLALFIVLYLLSLSGILLPDRTYSESENRYLSSLPSVSLKSLLSGSFMEKYGTYVSDQFPGRDLWISIRSFSEAILMKTENNGVVYGKNGYLFQKFLSYDTNALEDNLAAIDSFAAASSSCVYVMIVPSSYTVLEGKLPDGLSMADQASLLERGSEGRLGNLLSHCHVIDVLSVLRRHSDEYIYYRTDHHWTTDGAWYAYNLFCASSGLDAFVPDEKAAHEAGGFLGTSYYRCKKAGQETDTIKYYDFDAFLYADESEHDTLYDYTKLNSRDKYAMFLYGNGSERRITSSPGTGKRQSILVIKDSFADCLVPFLTANYENVTCIDPRYYAGSFSDLAAGEYDDILIVFGFEDLASESSILKLGF